MKMNQITTAIATLVLAAAPSMFAQDTANSTLQVTVAPEATISVTASPTLAKGTTEFESYVGDTTFTYRVRTMQVGGAGTVTAMVTAAFAADGPTTADLSHIAATTGAGTANGTSTTANAVTATNILTFGADAHSSDTNDSASISWTLVDRPAYKTGNYSTVVTLTISAT